MSEYNPPGGGGAGDVSKSDLAQNVTPRAIIWESGSTYYGKNTRTNVVVASGADPGEVFRQTWQAVASGNAPSQSTFLIKHGSYFFTSGISISGNYFSLIGEGYNKTQLFFDSPSSKVSGCINLNDPGQEVGNMYIGVASGFYAGITDVSNSHINIHDIFFDGPGETLSGAFAIKLNNSADGFVKHIELYSFDEGVHLLNTQTMHVEDIYSESFGTLVKLTGNSARNNSVYFVDATATSYLSGVVGIVSGADNNDVRSVQSSFSGPCVYLDSNSGTTRNKISDISNTHVINGIEILNNSPGKNFIGAYYPEVGIADTARFTIWVSGGIYQALRNNDGILIASGTNSANVFQTVMNTVAVSFDGMVHVKAGDYSFTSGFKMGGGVTLYGDPGGGTVFDWDSASGAISGAVRISGVRAAIRDIDFFGLSGVNPLIFIADTNVEIDNCEIDSNDGTNYSGLIGIYIAGGRGGVTLRNVGVYSHDTGIYMASGGPGVFPTVSQVTLDGILLGNCNCGVLLDAANNNIITNVIAEGTLTSGVVRMINMSNNNIVDNIIGGA